MPNSLISRNYQNRKKFAAFEPGARMPKNNTPKMHCRFIGKRRNHGAMPGSSRH
jgi:hypothetical protein